MLYHISKIAGLKILKPQVSTHKKAYVYAIENVVTGLLFGAPHDDFDFIISEENGIPVIMECYPNVLRSKKPPCRAVFPTRHREHRFFLFFLGCFIPEPGAAVVVQIQLVDVAGLAERTEPI